MKQDTLFSPVVLAVIIVFGNLAGCSGDQPDMTWPNVINKIRSKFPDVTHIQTEVLDSWLKGPEHETIVLVDAREKEEYQVSCIPGACHIPHNKNPLNDLKDIKPDRPYCGLLFRGLPFLHPR